jgi:hypothetical protein
MQQLPFRHFPVRGFPPSFRPWTGSGEISGHAPLDTCPKLKWTSFNPQIKTLNIKIYFFFILIYTLDAGLKKTRKIWSF